MWHWQCVLFPSFRSCMTYKYNMWVFQKFQTFLPLDFFSPTLYFACLVYGLNMFGKKTNFLKIRNFGEGCKVYFLTLISPLIIWQNLFPTKNRQTIQLVKDLKIT